jgi:RNA polymerase sigma-70 factor, ECF subfamily
MESQKHEITDRALVDALKLNQPGARELLYDRYSSHVQRVLTRVLGVDPALPGLLHDVFIEAFTNIRSIRKGSRLKGWLTSVTVFTARAHIRKRNRSSALWFGDTVTLPEVPAHGVDFEMREALAHTYLILNRLPADERIAFALRFLEGMELTEVADASRVSLSTIKRRLSRAQRRFFMRAKEYDTLREWVVHRESWSGR